jgi:hypothetical protein
MRLPYSIRTRGSALLAGASLITVPERHGYNLFQVNSGTDHASAALQRVTNGPRATLDLNWPSISYRMKW